MADYLLFDEGAAELLNNGLPATCYFLLSTKSVAATNPFAAGNTLAGATLGEITGTGYTRKSQAEVTASARQAAFAQMSWSTGAAVDWPTTVRACVLVTTVDNTGKAIYAWNLQPAGAVRDMSGANTTLNFTPTLGPYA